MEAKRKKNINNSTTLADRVRQHQQESDESNKIDNQQQEHKILVNKNGKIIPKSSNYCQQQISSKQSSQKHKSDSNNNHNNTSNMFNSRRQQRNYRDTDHEYDNNNDGIMDDEGSSQDNSQRQYKQKSKHRIDDNNSKNNGMSSRRAQNNWVQNGKHDKNQYSEDSGDEQYINSQNCRQDSDEDYHKQRPGRKQGHRRQRAQQHTETLDDGNSDHSQERRSSNSDSHQRSDSFYGQDRRNTSYDDDDQNGNQSDASSSSRQQENESIEEFRDDQGNQNANQSRYLDESSAQINQHHDESMRNYDDDHDQEDQGQDDRSSSVYQTDNNYSKQGSRLMRTKTKKQTNFGAATVIRSSQQRRTSNHESQLTSKEYESEPRLEFQESNKKPFVRQQTGYVKNKHSGNIDSLLNEDEDDLENEKPHYRQNNQDQDQIDEEEVEETMEQEDPIEDQISQSMSVRSKRRHLIRQLANENDYDEEELDEIENELRDEFVSVVGDEQGERMKQRQVASFVKLRTEIFKVTTSQTSIDRSQRDAKEQENQAKEKKQAPYQIFFGGSKEEKEKMFYTYANFGGGKKASSNKVRTQRYTALSWAPKSLILQFKRVSNIYFLIISVLTFLPFSPKNPISMIGTFVLVLIFTMIKEAYEDYQRYKSDREMNNKVCKVLCPDTHQWEEKKWQNLAPGDIIQIECDQESPSDILILHTSNKSGCVFVDTMNLDGETNLKERLAMNEVLEDKSRMQYVKGEIVCESPNENLEKWEAQITYSKSLFKDKACSIKNLLLRGCFVRNTQEVLGIVVYTGMDTKIMRNLKKPPHKVSNIMKQMNRMLWSVFAFQFILIILFAGLYLNWTTEHSRQHFYLMIVSLPAFIICVQNSDQEDADTFFIQLLVFWVAYSHMIPISLYVIIEVLKLGQATYINKDVHMYDQETQSYAVARNSDLIEELGQVEMVFSDKTGTLTQNKMVFKKCQINGQRFGELKPNEVDCIDGMAQSGLKEIKEILKQERQDFHRMQTLTSNNMSSTNSNHPYVTHFFLNLALCNTVMVDYVQNNGKKEPKYKAASPDELALVLGAKNAGVHLISREHNRVKVYNSATKETLAFKVIAEFPFDSVRKRMSVILKDLQSGTYKILCKGADSVMMERMIFEKNGIEGLQSIINEDLYQYSCEGLRTLLFAHRNIIEEEFQSFKRIYKHLQQSIGPSKEQKLLSLYDEMEQKLRYIGCSAIEDKLQDGVAVTIAKLMSADIRFFMLTGDKLETAIEIARSCQVIQEKMKVVVIKKTKDDVYKKMLKIADKKGIDMDEKVQSLKEVELFNQVIALEGSTLSLILEDEELQNLFFHIAIRSKSVVCCRMSPKQKADVVNIFKKRGKWITLAVGDGANDVSMIMEAHIGVGIKGKEGTQAVRSADFSISQFQFLLRLLIFQGRNGYLRVSSMICYYFYKNIVLVLTELYFPFFNGFSGQIYFLDWLPMMYNAIFTSWHSLFTLLLEKDVNYHFTYRYPQIYKAGQLRLHFNYMVFWKWIILAVWHGVVCYFLPIIANDISSNSTGQRTEHWVPSTISFTLIIHLVIFKLLLETRHLSKISLIFGFFCLLIYYTFLSLHSATQIIDIIQPQIFGVPTEMLKQPRFYLIILGGPLLCLLPDFFFNMIRQIFYPNPIDKVLYEQKYVEPEWDHKEIILKLQKNQQMKKRISAIYSEHRKILLQQRKTSFSVHEVKRQQSSVNYRMNSSKFGSQFDFNSTHRLSSNSPKNASSNGDQDQRAMRKSTFYSQKKKKAEMKGSSASHSRSRSREGDISLTNQLQGDDDFFDNNEANDQMKNDPSYLRKRTISISRQKSKYDPHQRRNKGSQHLNGSPVEFNLGITRQVTNQDSWKQYRKKTAEFKPESSMKSERDGLLEGALEEIKNEEQNPKNTGMLQYFEDLGKTVKQSFGNSPPQQQAPTSSEKKNIFLLTVPPPSQQDQSQNQTKKQGRHITFSINNTQDNSVSKEIESASSFSGNESDSRPPSPLLNPNQVFQKDKMPQRSSLKQPSDSALRNSKVGISQENVINDKPNNIQEDTIPDVGMGPGSMKNESRDKISISLKNSETADKFGKTTVSSQFSNAPINIETFKKICANRTANFFLISNNYSIPQSRPHAAQDIDDLSRQTPSFSEKNENFEQQNDPKSLLEAMVKAEVGKNHPLEKAFPIAFYRARPESLTHKKAPKKYVQKYRNLSQIAANKEGKIGQNNSKKL